MLGCIPTCYFPKGKIQSSYEVSFLLYETETFPVLNYHRVGGWDVATLPSIQTSWLLPPQGWGLGPIYFHLHLVHITAQFLTYDTYKEQASRSPSDSVRGTHREVFQAEDPNTTQILALQGFKTGFRCQNQISQWAGPDRSLLTVWKSLSSCPLIQPLVTRGPRQAGREGLGA